MKKFETSEGIVEAENRTRAYKHKNFTLLYDFKANTINNIWILSDFSKQKNDNDLAIKLLNNIDKKYHLILVDWNSSEYIDLAKKEQIKKYLDKFNH